jgi:uncharacterized membrane protein
MNDREILLTQVAQKGWHVVSGNTLDADNAALLGLIVLGLLWELWLAPIRPGGSWLALKVLPLCIPLAGLLKNRMYTYRWVSLMVWLYFAEGITRATSDRAPSSYLAMIEVVLCVMLFAACALHVRLRLKKT